MQGLLRTGCAISSWWRVSRQPSVLHGFAANIDSHTDWHPKPRLEILHHLGRVQLFLRSTRLLLLSRDGGSDSRRFGCILSRVTTSVGVPGQRCHKLETAGKVYRERAGGCEKSQWCERDGVSTVQQSQLRIEKQFLCCCAGWWIGEKRQRSAPGGGGCIEEGDV